MQHIGIMTWYYGVNYGALAQSIALYNVVKNLGYECSMINYRPKKYAETVRYANLPRRKDLYKISRVIGGLIKIKNLSTTKYFSTTKAVKSAFDINSLELDKIIFGSDAIFNVKHPMCDQLFFGVGITCKKVAYSPSCEYLEPDYVLPSEYDEALCEMEMISVRDIFTHDLVMNNTGISAEITLDPSFLYDFIGIGKEVCKEKYILIYSFSEWNEYGKFIVTYAKEKGLLIVCVGQKLKWADISIDNATFEQWIGAFREASIVMTDSFHGTVFSIKNKKQMILCGREDKKAKIDSLLKQLGIFLNIYEGEDIESYLSKNAIDYAEKQQTINIEIEKSMRYLTSALR